VENNECAFSLGLGFDLRGNPGICLMLHPASTITRDNGETQPGIVLPAADARALAYALLLNAEQLGSGLVPLPRPFGRATEPEDERRAARKW
jgi:hypothetical protein